MKFYLHVRLRPRDKWKVWDMTYATDTERPRKRTAQQNATSNFRRQRAKGMDSLGSAFFRWKVSTSKTAI